MKKFRCAKCKTEFQGKLEICPQCGTRLHYLDEEVKKETVAPKKDFYFDDDRVLNKGIQDDEDIRKENSQVSIRQLDEPKQETKDSYFDGLLIQKILWVLLGTLITVLSLFIAFPAAMCMVYRWEMRHTVIEGRRLDFDGKGSQLLGRYLLWLLLTILTAGIFLYWLAINLKKWKTKHTIFMKPKTITY